MRKEQSRAIGLFFFLGFMDERLALSAASRVIAKLKAEYSDPQNEDLDNIPAPAVIAACRESWKSFRRHSTIRQRGGSSLGEELTWCRSPKIDLEIWAKYQQDAPDDDLMTLLFSTVLGVTDAEMAEGFETSVGTIRYRLGKGVLQLGLVAR